MYELFLQVHLILALFAALALLKHLLPVGGSAFMFPTISLSLWALNNLLRGLRMAYFNIGGRRQAGADQADQANITHFFEDSTQSVVSAMRMTISLRRPLKICPGQYVYIFLSDMGTRRRFQSHPYTVTWWDDSLAAMSLSLLIKPQNGLSVDVMAQRSVRSVIIDGPYGKDLGLENFETVILVAKGIGIAGILPHIRHMTYRRASKDKDHEAYRRGLITRKLDVFWELEENSQEDWVSDWIAELQKRDSDNVSGKFWLRRRANDHSCS